MIRFSTRHPVTIGMATAAVALFGILAALRLPVDLLPRIDYPTLTLRSEFPGAAPPEVEELLTRPLEEAVGVVSAVQRVVSRSLPNRSEIQLQFAWGRDIDFAALDVREQLDRVRLPEGATRPVVLRYDPNQDPILRLGLSGSGDQSTLRDLAERVIERNLETVEGVAAVKLLGGVEEEILVALDQERLFALGLSPELVRSRLAGENLNRAGGSLVVGDSRYLVRILNEFRSAPELARLVLRAEGGRRVRLGDVARVERRPREREVITHIDGHEAVELALYREGDANTVAVARRVAERLRQIEERLPEEVRLTTIHDQSEFITASAREVILAAVYGGLLAICVLFVFLRDLRSTLVVAAAIPISVLFALLLLFRLGLSVNIMTLGGLALGVGMVVDSSIVVLEAIARRRERGERALEAADRGTGEVAGAVVASTLTTCAVFFPIVFVEGLAGALFRDLSLTVAAALAGSLLVSLTLIPMLVARAGAAQGGGDRRAAGAGSREGSVGWADPEPLHPEHRGRIARFAERWLLGLVAWLLRWSGRAWSLMRRGSGRAWEPLLGRFDRGFGRLERAYPRIVRAALRQRGAVLAGSALLFGVALWGLQKLGVELIPDLAQGRFELVVRLPDGTPIDTTERIVTDLERHLAELEGVARVSSVIGGSGADALDADAQGPGDARIGVTLEDAGDRRAEARLESRARRILAAVPDLVFELTRPTLFTLEAPLEVEVYGADLTRIAATAEAIAAALDSLPQLSDPSLSTRSGSPELVVHFDPVKLAHAGLDPASASRLVRERLEGTVATRLRRGEEVVDVRIRGVDTDRRTIAALGDFILNPGATRPVRLRSVARIERALGPTEIRRIAQERAVVVRADLGESIDLRGAVDLVERTLATLPRPAGVRADLAGQSRELDASFESLRLALLLALFLVYLVMASQFESLVHPFVILLTVPLGGTGVVAALAAANRPVDVVVLIGAIMLAGIMVNNSIVLVDAVNRRRAAGLAIDQALVEAGSLRLRPILMTTVTTVLGLVPMALGLGEGGELRAPLALTVIGGLSVSTLISLVVVPVLYATLDRFARRRWSAPGVEETRAETPGQGR